MGSTIAIRSSDITTEGYLALPKEAGPGIVVVHDWFGLLPHIQRACDELAGSGFVALAPDLYQGRSTTDPGQAETLRDELDLGETRGRIDAAIQHLRTHPQVSPDRVGAIGYSNGGWLTLLTATTGSLDAAVVYYATVEPEKTASIACPVLGHFAEVDEWEPDSTTEHFVAGLQNQGTVIEQRIYPGTEHSFANADVAAFVPDAAQQAWAETVAFLRRHLT